MHHTVAIATYSCYKSAVSKLRCKQMQAEPWRSLEALLPSYFYSLDHVDWFAFSHFWNDHTLSIAVIDYGFTLLDISSKPDLLWSLVYALRLNFPFHTSSNWIGRKCRIAALFARLDLFQCHVQWGYSITTSPQSSNSSDYPNFVSRPSMYECCMWLTVV